jgi:hypothetical protein
MRSRLSQEIPTHTIMQATTQNEFHTRNEIDRTQSSLPATEIHHQQIQPSIRVLPTQHNDLRRSTTSTTLLIEKLYHEEFGRQITID